MYKLALKLLVLFLFALCVHFIWGWQELFAIFKAFAQGNANPLYFFAIMGVGCAFGFPVSWCYIFAGTAFGVAFGWTYCIFGIFTSSSIGFLASKWLLQKSQILKFEKFFKVDATKIKATYHANFFIRAVPGVPYFLQNFILTDIKTTYLMYISMTLLVQGPIAFAVIFLSASIAESTFLKIIMAVLLLIILILIHRLMLRHYCKKEEIAQCPNRL